jgi:hypothetical protein
MSEILKPETVTAREAQEARAHKLLRRQYADGYIKALLAIDAKQNLDIGIDPIDWVVDRALALADCLIEKTGGPG